jgi:colicin import membrane protein
MTPTSGVSGIGPHLVVSLSKKGILTAEQLAALSPEDLRDIPGIGARRAASLLAAARRALEIAPTKPSKMPKAAAPPVPRKAPVKTQPVSASNKVETAPAPQMPAIKVDKDSKKSAAKKAAKKAMKAQKKLAAEEKAKKKAVAKKAARKKADKKKAKKKIKASKSKMAGKPKKK